MVVPYYILFASIATLIILMNGTFLTFPKGGRPVDIFMKILCGVAIFFWTMDVFGKPSVGAFVTSGILALFAFLIGPLKGSTTVMDSGQIDMRPPTVQIGTEFDLPYIGHTGKIYCPTGQEGNYLGILDTNHESIIVYSETKFEAEEKFIITGVKNGKILIDKIEK